MQYNLHKVFKCQDFVLLHANQIQHHTTKIHLSCPLVQLCICLGLFNSAAVKQLLFLTDDFVFIDCSNLVHCMLDTWAIINTVEFLMNFVSITAMSDLIIYHTKLICLLFHSSYLKNIFYSQDRFSLMTTCNKIANEN